MRNSNINVGREESLGGVKAYIDITSYPLGTLRMSWQGNFPQHMAVQTCHVSPISELPFNNKISVQSRGDHENGKKKSRNQLGHTYDKNEKYLFGEDSVSFAHEFTLSLAFHSFLISFQSNFNNFLLLNSIVSFSAGVH